MKKHRTLSIFIFLLMAVLTACSALPANLVANPVAIPTQPAQVEPVAVAYTGPTSSTRWIRRQP